MREIQAAEITRAVRDLCIETNRVLPQDLEEQIRSGAKRETCPMAQAIFGDLCANLDAGPCADFASLPGYRYGCCFCGSWAGPAYSGQL